MTVLVICAHPDDEVLGCGGTMARLAREGRTVEVAILGEGISSRYGSREAADRELLNRVVEDARQAASLLGAQPPIFGGLPDNRFDTVALLDVVKKVERLIRDLRPTTVYTHHAGDLNVDHQVTHRAVLTATRPPGSSVREIFAFEVLSSSEWAFGGVGPSRFQPNVFVDVEKTLDLKIRAMETYETEIRSFPHPRSEGGIRALAQLRGSTAGYAAAEAFELVRALWPQGENP